MFDFDVFMSIVSSFLLQKFRIDSLVLKNRYPSKLSEYINPEAQTLRAALARSAAPVSSATPTGKNTRHHARPVTALLAQSISLIITCTLTCGLEVIVSEMTDYFL